MNKTPVLTEKQQRQSLSAKKKPQKASLKNVLSQPYKQYWPQITEDEAKALIDELSRIQLSSDDATNSTIWKSKIVTIGLNATLRSLNTGNVDILVVSASIKPKYVVNQTIMLGIARNKNIKIVCVQGLNELLAKTIGFASCLCFSMSNVASVTQLNGFHKTVANLSSRFSIPKQFKRPKATDDQPMEIDHEHTLSTKQDVGPVSFNDIYVTKKASGRSFIPAGTVHRPKTTNDWSDFISLSDAGNLKANQKGQNQVGIAKKQKHLIQNQLNSKHCKIANKTNYVNLCVNRIQANPNKVKKSK